MMCVAKPTGCLSLEAMDEDGFKVVYQMTSCGVGPAQATGGFTWLARRERIRIIQRWFRIRIRCLVQLASSLGGGGRAVEASFRRLRLVKVQACSKQ